MDVLPYSLTNRKRNSSHSKYLCHVECTLDTEPEEMIVHKDRNLEATALLLNDYMQHYQHASHTFDFLILSKSKYNVLFELIEILRVNDLPSVESIRPKSSTELLLCPFLANFIA